MISRLKEFIGNLSPSVKRIIGNTGWLLADKVLRLLTGVFIWVWIARYLGPSDFGIFNYAIALVALLTPVATLGLENIIVRDLVVKKDQRGETLASALALRSFGGILTVILSAIIIYTLRPNEALVQKIVILIAAGTILQSADVIEYYFQSEVLSKYPVIAKNTAFMAANGAKVVLILIEAPLIAFAWVFLFEIAAGSAGLIIVYRLARKAAIRWKIDKNRLKEILKDCIPLALSSSAVLLYMKIDVVILGEMRGETEVGIYSAAVKISESFYFLSTIISSSVFPMLIGNPQLFYERLKKIFTIMSGISYLIIIPVVLLSPILIKIFGEEYTTAGPVLAIHIGAIIFVFWGVVQGTWYVREGTKGLYMQLRRTFTGALLNIILNIILIPHYGSNGAAAATLISYSYVGYFCNIFNKETVGIFKMQTKSLLLFNYFK